MAKKYFRSSCELGIVSDTLSCDDITELLQIPPTRTINKGDIYEIPRFKIHAERPQTVWAHESKEYFSARENLSPHIKYFRKLLKKKIEILKMIKSNPNNDVTFWIWLSQDAGGAGLEFDSEELKFIHEISNRLHISVLSKDW